MPRRENLPFLRELKLSQQLSDQTPRHILQKYLNPQLASSQFYEILNHSDTTEITTNSYHSLNNPHLYYPDIIPSFCIHETNMHPYAFQKIKGPIPQPPAPNQALSVKYEISYQIENHIWKHTNYLVTNSSFHLPNTFSQPMMDLIVRLQKYQLNCQNLPNYLQNYLLL